MNPNQLLAHFDRISESPDAVPRLRRFVLDLAVRGKLVEQDPADESASALLKRIDDARARLVKEKLLRKTNVPMPPTVDEVPYESPCGWEWSRLSIVGEIGPRNDIDDATEVSFLPMTTISDGFAGTIQPEIRTWGEIKKGFTHVADGDIAMAKITPCFQNRKSAVMRGLKNGIGAGTTELHVVRPIDGAMVPEYVLLQLKSHTYLDVGVSKMTGTAGQKRVPKEYFADTPFPLPPFAEQRRIVAKVDELMGLCDRLEAAQGERETRRDRLNRASLHRLNNGASPPLPLGEGRGEGADAFRDHARFHLRHLSRLTTRPEHISDLRQTILNLAVRGKLVPQDPIDEPASDLLKHIESEKSRLIKAGQLRGKATVTPMKPDHGVEQIPTSWVCVPFGEIMFSRDGERIPVSKEERNGRGKTYDYYGASGVIDKIDDFLFDKPLLLIGEDGANLINRSTPIAFIARGKYWVNNHAHVLDGISEEFLRYIELHINAIDLKPYVTGTAKPKMNQAKMNSIPIALPPLAEQHRIVAKVDELMKLCDQLESQLTTTQTESRRLLEAILHEAFAPAESV